MGGGRWPCYQRRALDYRKRKLSSYDAINMTSTYKQDKHSTHKQGHFKPTTCTAVIHTPNTPDSRYSFTRHTQWKIKNTRSFLSYWGNITDHRTRSNRAISFTVHSDHSSTQELKVLLLSSEEAANQVSISSPAEASSGCGVSTETEDKHAQESQPRPARLNCPGNDGGRRGQIRICTSHWSLGAD